MQMNNHKILKACLSVMFCLLADVALAQSFVISGTIKDEKGEPLIGASIYAKDKPGTGTVADLDGNFSLKVERGDKVQFTYIAYLTKEYLALKEVKNLLITLQPDEATLDEVVVEAFGTKARKITSTGAVTSVDVSTLQVPATSLNNMLAGRVAGVIATQSSGEPGKNISEFWVRGIGTFGYSSGALVLIDGLEGNLNDVDPADVESFSVLKDASATAMYGVRGANGVVLVTTKRGKNEKLKFTTRANVTVSWLKRLPEYCGSYDYAKLANEALAVRGLDKKYSDLELETIQYGLDPDLYPNVNWQDEILNKAAWQQTYYASVQGGGSIARYFFSLNYSNESSVYKQDAASRYFNDVAYNTYGLRANLDMNLTKTTVLYFGVTANKSVNNLPGGISTSDLWSICSRLTPLSMPVRYSNGALPSASSSKGLNSPYVSLNHTGSTVKESNNSVFTLSLNQDLGMITSGLKFNVQGAYTSKEWINETRKLTPELWYYNGRDANGNLTGSRQTVALPVAFSKSTDMYRKYFLQSTITWNRQFGDAHNLNALLHYEMSDEKTESKASDTMSAIPVRYQGISAKVGYNYGDTYLVDANFGYTGSENFQPGRQFGFFPSVSAGWVPSNYKWVKNKLPWINYFKIRASYGLVGNDRITSTRFPYLTSVTVNSGGTTAWQYKGGSIVENSIGADNLKWEKAKKFDIGFEGKLFGRFEYTVDIFHDTRDGIFQQRQQVPDFVGLVNMPYGNVGQMVSYGSDGNFTYTQPINKDMDFVLRGNFTYSTNKVKYFEEADTKYEYYSSVGRPYGYQKGYISLGLFRDQDDIDNSAKQTFGDYMPGDIKYKDVNGDGVINSDDQVPLSYSNYPRFQYGFGGEFRYKKLRVGFLFNGIGNTTYYRIYTNGGSNVGYMPFYEESFGNILTLAADPANRWIPADYDDPSIPASMRENPNALFPRLSYGKNNNNSQTSTFWQGNRRYLNLAEISIYYTLDGRFVRRLGIHNIDLALIGQNLHTWDTVKLFDPEIAGSNGLEYPIPGRVSLQATITF